MPSPLDHQSLEDALLRHLRAEGPSSAAALCAALQTTQPTLSRLIKAQGDAILKIGAARATRYAARRRIADLPAPIPVYEIGLEETHRLGFLHPIHPKGHFFESDTELTGIYDDLPWFLNDLRPSGFLGRLIPRQHPELGHPSDVRDWSGDQVLVWLHLHGVDLVGDLIVGDTAFQRSLSSTPIHPTPAPARPERYLHLAIDALAGAEPGSSAGGEQAKFLATRMDGRYPTPVIVKFSPPAHHPAARRTADLLRCEHLALATVRRGGLPAARSTLLEAGDRVFLEVERFDRVGRAKRRGVVSLLTLDDEFVGHRESWTDTAEILHSEGRINDETLLRVLWLDRFGAWIGNTDRHGGNLSLFFERGRLGGLTPVYDMLPMHYAPRNGELVDTPMALPTPSAVRPDLWRSAWEAALDFWEQVAQDPTLHPTFTAIALENAERVAAQQATVDRLPR